MNKSTTYLVIGAVVLAAVAGVVVFQQRQGTEQQLASQSEQQGGEEEPGLSVNSVMYTNSGYASQAYSVKAGDTVTWINQSTNPMWPATAVHPTHEVYPGSGIAKCQTTEAATIFDACKPIAPGEEWSFSFTEKGSWGYHDHLSPNHRGTITVE
ncbi:MAG: hypothetical protein Q7K38_02930 [Candidatus Wildermuthbacteria bacterium]|nr:hypothetical protein [Candidatus Wildermuthbacteria bacterium]